MRKLILLSLFLVATADARLPRGCPCNGLDLAKTPTFNPIQGTYPSTQNITVSTTTPGSTLYCTTDGSLPTSASPVCTNPEVISVTTTLKATAYATGFNPSVAGVAKYTISSQADPAVISPISGTYAAVNATMTCSTPACVIHYSIGGVPNCSSTTYTVAVNVPSTNSLSAIVCAVGYTNSSITTENYVISGALSACATGVSSGTLSGIATATRRNGRSPLLVFVNATGTTDSGLINANATPFQDVIYTWNFGDSGVSGTGKWEYGSNPGVNGMNTAAGGVAAHEYVVTDGAGDTTFTITLTMNDGVNSAVQCTIPVTVYDPTGANGYPTTATTCYFNSTVGSGCPAGATQVGSTSSFTSVLNTNISNKRLLFKCGDTFTGNNPQPSGSGGSIGAYGSCINTQSGRPIFNITSNNGLTFAATSFDQRFVDIDIEGSGVHVGNGTALQFNGSGLTYPYQILIGNVLVNGVPKSFYNFGGHESGLIRFVSTGMGNTDGTFINNSENQCLNGSTAFNCGNGGSTYNPANYASVNYWALIGNLFDGTGANGGTTNGWETVRISACDYCIISNTTIQNAFLGGAVLKFHDGNAGSQAKWTGQPVQYVVISDSAFGGTSGAQLIELAPQNGSDDERLMNILFERNLLSQTVNDSTHNIKMIASVQNGAFRDNVCSTPNGSNSSFCIQIVRRGVEGAFTPGAPVFPSWPQYDEVYNNACYGTLCIAFSGLSFTPNGGPGNNGWGINNMFYRLSGSAPTVTNTGTGNTVSNNTPTPTNNPSFLNASGFFNIISDFKPTTNYSGGISAQQPVLYDAVGVLFNLPYDLGAVQH